MIKKLYICIPGNAVSGGPETLHQFADIVYKYCNDTFVFYYGNKSSYKVPEKYKKYNINIATDIEDSVNNLIIVPEIALGYLQGLSYINKCVWWLSVDNYYEKNYRYKLPFKVSNRPFLVKCLSFLMSIAIVVFRKATGHFYTVSGLDQDVFHLYNCEYAREFLLENGIDKNRMTYLCGPLEKIYFEPFDVDEVISKKKNIIVYNYAKGLRYIKMLEKENYNRYQFVAIKDMTSEQVRDLLLSAKLYVDFGYFPGPERIPRQAAMCYCSIVTSTSGSAANEIDIPIPQNNKISLKHFDAKKAYGKVVEIMNNYENDIKLYDYYRDKVKRQDMIFEDNIKEFIQRY